MIFFCETHKVLEKLNMFNIISSVAVNLNIELGTSVIYVRVYGAV